MYKQGGKEPKEGASKQSCRINSNPSTSDSTGAGSLTAIFMQSFPWLRKERPGEGVSGCLDLKAPAAEEEEGLRSLETSAH